MKKGLLSEALALTQGGNNYSYFSNPLIQYSIYSADITQLPSEYPITIADPTGSPVVIVLGDPGGRIGDNANDLASLQSLGAAAILSNNYSYVSSFIPLSFELSSTVSSINYGGYDREVKVQGALGAL
jgi:hypothetical protein